MAENNRNDQQTPAKRQRYEKPTVLSEEVFETLALSCAHTDPLICNDGTDRS